MPDDLLLAWQYVTRYEEKVGEAAEFLREVLGDGEPPSFGLVLGSGLGDVAGALESGPGHVATLAYSEVPNFPPPTVEGHAGQLVVGELSGVRVVGLKGRKHYYEVADAPFHAGPLQVTFAVHVLAELGVAGYFSTNAVGGLNPAYEVGDAVVLRSHVNFIPNPLAGRRFRFSRVDGSPVERFPPMNEAYDPTYRRWLVDACPDPSRVHEGVLVAVTGPSYETEAECVAFRRMGADVVGMSTAPEVVAARSRGMRVVAMSVVTNVIDEFGNNAASHEEVVEALESKEVRERLAATVVNFFAKVAAGGGAAGEARGALGGG